MNARCQDWSRLRSAGRRACLWLSPASGRARGRTLAALLGSAVWAGAAEIPKAPVPASPFLPVVYRYADTLLDRGRDTYGPQRTGLLLSALDRSTLAPLTNRPPAPRGVREEERAGATGAALTGANPHHDQNLLRLLYTLSELSGKPKYSNAAASALTFFINHAASTGTAHWSWGGRRAWDVLTDEPVGFVGAAPGGHEFLRPWLLWDRCFDLAPAASRRLALGLWEGQTNGMRARPLERPEMQPPDRNGPRPGGFCIRSWAVAYARSRDELFLSAVERTLLRLEGERRSSTGWSAAHSGDSNAPVSSRLSLAIDCDGAAHEMPGQLAARLRAVAAREDERFCSLPHDLRDRRGFVAGVDPASGKPASDRTPLWSARAGGMTTAQVALMCVSRYENTGRVAYRELIHAAADTYLAAPPDEEMGLWPGTLGHVISLQLAAWRSTAQARYLERARELGRFALDKFFAGSPLPRASRESDHYETITGADTLALALVELHLHVLHITAVRCPPNSIDR